MNESWLKHESNIRRKKQRQCNAIINERRPTGGIAGHQGDTFLARHEKQIIILGNSRVLGWEGKEGINHSGDQLSREIL